MSSSNIKDSSFMEESKRSENSDFEEDSSKRSELEKKKAKKNQKFSLIRKKTQM